MEQARAPRAPDARAQDGAQDHVAEGVEQQKHDSQVRRQARAEEEHVQARREEEHRVQHEELERDEEGDGYQSNGCEGDSWEGDGQQELKRTSPCSGLERR